MELSMFGETLAAETSAVHYEPLPPGSLILDGKSAVTLAVCGHWWQVPYVNLGTMQRADAIDTSTIWAPIANCGPCHELQRIVAVLERVGGALQSLPTQDGPVEDVRRMILELVTATVTHAPIVPDNGARAVVVLTSWDEGATHPRTRTLARCTRRLGCPYALGHPGTCEAGPGAPVGASLAVLDPFTIEQAHADAVDAQYPGLDASALGEEAATEAGEQIGELLDVDAAPETGFLASIADLVPPIVDIGGYLPCGCHGDQRDHDCDLRSAHVD